MIIDRTTLIFFDASCLIRSGAASAIAAAGSPTEDIVFFAIY
jgi:hypothetical protein